MQNNLRFLVRIFTILSISIYSKGVVDSPVCQSGTSAGTLTQGFTTNVSVLVRVITICTFIMPLPSKAPVGPNLSRHNVIQLKHTTQLELFSTTTIGNGV
jgi:hypothetical protein